MSTWQPSGPDPGEQVPRRLDEFLDRATRRLGGPTTGTTTTVFARWEEVVGVDIAAHARPVSLRHGVLLLAVDHAAWATQLRYMTAELLGRIADATGTADAPEVAEIRIRVTGQPDPDAPRRGGARRGRKPPP